MTRRGLAAAAEALAAFRRDLEVVRERSRRAGSTSPSAASFADMSTIALALLRGSIALRRATGRSLGSRGVLRWVFHIDVWTDDIGAGLALPHPFNLVIGSGARIGKDCTLMHNTTVQHGAGTRLGDRVVLGVGCVVLAGKKIGEEAFCGANSVVTHDVPPRATVAGAPARVLRVRQEEAHAE